MTWKRIATAAVLIPLVILVVLRAGLGLVALATALVALLALFEYFRLGEAIGHRAHRFWTGTCTLLLVYLQWRAAGRESFELAGGVAVYHAERWFSGGLPSLEIAFFVFVLGIALITLFTRRPLVEALPAAGISASGLLLVAFPLTYALRLVRAGPEGPKLLLFALAIVWVSDSVAYFVGRAIGKHRLAPHLSPQKSWEGALAGLLGSVGTALLFERWLALPRAGLLAMAVAGNLAGQAGDLLESAYKRSAGVKDSGSLLPGHGGVLDRIDALILAIPVVWYYWLLIYSPRS